MRSAPFLTALGAAAIALVAASGTARASEGVKHVGVQAGFAGVSGSEGSFSGFGGAITGRYDFTDAWSIALNATATNNQVVAKGGRSWVFSQAAGLVYSLDVIQFVPYIGGNVGVYELTGGGLPKTDLRLGAQLVVGLDWMLTRDWTLGLEIREHVLPKDLLDSPSNPTPFYTTMFVKASFAWGWF